MENKRDKKILNFSLIRTFSSKKEKILIIKIIILIILHLIILLLILFLLLKYPENLKSTINLLEGFYIPKNSDKVILEYLSDINNIQIVINFIYRKLIMTLFSILFSIIFIYIFKYSPAFFFFTLKKEPRVHFNENVQIKNFNPQAPPTHISEENDTFFILTSLLNEQEKLIKYIGLLFKDHDKLLEGQEKIIDSIDDLEGKLDKQNKPGPLLNSVQTQFSSLIQTTEQTSQTIAQRLVSSSTQTDVVNTAPILPTQALLPQQPTVPDSSTIINMGEAYDGTDNTSTNTNTLIQINEDSNQVSSPQGIGRNLLYSACIVGASSILSNLIPTLINYFIGN